MARGDRASPRCHVCTSQFRFAGPEPYLMPCLHSVCQTCIALECKHIFCNSCEQQFQNDGSFPKDTAEAKSIFLTTLKNCPSEVCCTNRNDGQKATSWCPQCEALLCYTCEEMHKDIKLTKSHEVTPLSSLLQAQEGLNPKAIPCPHHPDLHLLLYDDTCEKLICYKCKADDHAECKSSDPGLVCGEFKNSHLPGAMKQLEERKEAIALVEIEINDLSNILDPKLMAVKESIHQSFENLRASLNQRERDLKEQAEICFKAVKENTNQRLKELYLDKVRMDAVLSMCEKSQTISLPPLMLCMKTPLNHRIDQCLEEQLPKVSKREAEITFSNKDEKDLQDVISSVGILYSTWANASGPLHSPPGILSETRTQLMACQEEKLYAEKLHGICSDKLNHTKDMLHETEKQLKHTQEKWRQDKNQISVCVEKLKKASAFIEKASFTVSFPRNMKDSVYSSEQVLKTKTCYIDLTEEDGYLGTYVMFGRSRYGSRKPKVGWSCKVKATFKIQGNIGAPITKYFDSEFDQDNTGLGFSGVFPMWKLQEGTAKLQVDVEAWESKGLIPLEDQFRKDFDEALVTLKSTIE